LDYDYILQPFFTVASPVLLKGMLHIYGDIRNAFILVHEDSRMNIVFCLPVSVRKPHRVKPLRTQRDGLGFCGDSDDPFVFHDSFTFLERLDVYYIV